MRRKRVRGSMCLARQDDIIALHQSNHILKLPIGEHAYVHVLNHQNLGKKGHVFTCEATVIKLSVGRAFMKIDEIILSEPEWKLHIKYEITP